MLGIKPGPAHIKLYYHWHPLYTFVDSCAQLRLSCGYKCRWDEHFQILIKEKGEVEVILQQVMGLPCMQQLPATHLVLQSPSRHLGVSDKALSMAQMKKRKNGKSKGSVHSRLSMISNLSLCFVNHIHKCGNISSLHQYCRSACH